ncbi:MAG: alpha/beta hydrolase [Streptosporangiaceae bacterium]
MPEPQSTLFFLLMLIVFGALVWWLVVAKQVVFRVLAACLAFIPAMMFGVAAVNKYYDYYQNWSAAVGDLTNHGVQAAAEVPAGSHGHAHFSEFLGNQIDFQVAAQLGYTLHLEVTGAASHLTRAVYVYLPPQYFQSAYRHYRFPAVELLHGFPGQPQDWITVIGAPTMLQTLISRSEAKPAVLVMPDINGGRGISLQCLNQYHGPQDATFLALDLPEYISHKLRVIHPGRAWGIAGYSEGGFCAANLGLQYGYRFGYSGVLSGYFVPSDNQLGNPPRQVNPFGGNKKLARRNTPVDFLTSLPPGRQVPQFWIGAGAADSGDIRNAEIFSQLVRQYQPSVQLRTVPGGGHTMLTWRKLMPQLLEWMTPKQAAVVRYETAHPYRYARNHRHHPAVGASSSGSAAPSSSTAKSGQHRHHRRAAHAKG